MTRVRTRYKPANRSTDLPPGTGRAAMDSFLLSERVQKVSLDAAADMAGEIVDIIINEASETYELASSVDVQPGRVMVIAGNPRSSAVITMHGGVPPRATDPESSTGAIAEFGNSRREAVAPMGRVARRYDSPRRPL